MSRLHWLSFCTLLITQSTLADSALATAVPPPHACLTQEAPSASLDLAYQRQQRDNSQRQQQDAIIGFKAGLTTLPQQQRYAISGPVFAALFASGELAAKSAITLDHYRLPKLETEIGFIAAVRIHAPVLSTAELRHYFQFVVPVIEIPDVSFVSGCQPNAVDLVAANVAAASHLRGNALRWADLPTLAELRVSLTRDGELIAAGSAQDVLQGVDAMLLFLVNEAVRQGYAIEPGQLFITGAMSGLIEAKPGAHHADFGALGTISFEVLLGEGK